MICSPVTKLRGCIASGAQTILDNEKDRARSILRGSPHSRRSCPRPLPNFYPSRSAALPRIVLRCLSTVPPHTPLPIRRSHGSYITRGKLRKVVVDNIICSTDK